MLRPISTQLKKPVVALSVSLFFLAGLYILIHINSMWDLEICYDEHIALMNTAYLHGFPILTPVDFHIPSYDVPIQATIFLYYRVLQGWTSLVGYGLPQLRLLSIVFGFFCVVAIYLLGGQLFSRRVGFWAALSLLFSLSFMEHTAIVRFESAYWFFWYLSLFLIARYGHSPKAGTHMLIGVVCGLSMLIWHRGWAAYVQGLCFYIWASKSENLKRSIFFFSLSSLPFFALSILVAIKNMVAFTTFNVYTPNVLTGSIFLRNVVHLMESFFNLDFTGYKWGGRSIEVFWNVQVLLIVFSILAMLGQRGKYLNYLKMFIPTFIYVLVSAPVFPRMWINFIPYFALAIGVFAEWIFSAVRDSVKHFNSLVGLMIVSVAGMLFTYDPGSYISVEGVLPLILLGLGALGIFIRPSFRYIFPIAIVLIFFTLTTHLPEFLSTWSNIGVRKIIFGGSCFFFTVFYFLKIKGDSSLRLAQAVGALLLIFTCRNGYALVTGQGFPSAFPRAVSSKEFLNREPLVPGKEKILGDDELWWSHRDHPFYGRKHLVMLEYGNYFWDVNTLSSVALQYQPSYILLSRESVLSLFKRDSIPAWWLNRFPAEINVSKTSKNGGIFTIVHLDWARRAGKRHPSTQNFVD